MEPPLIQQRRKDFMTICEDISMPYQKANLLCNCYINQLTLQSVYHDNIDRVIMETCNSLGFFLNLLNFVIHLDRLYEDIKSLTIHLLEIEFQSEDEDCVKLAKLGNEFGSTTGRKRQVNWLNVDRLKKAIIMNGVTKLIINKCDIIQKLGKYKILND